MKRLYKVLVSEIRFIEATLPGHLCLEWCFTNGSQEDHLIRLRVQIRMMMMMIMMMMMMMMMEGRDQRVLREKL